ncbi:MAG TPA: zinc carboxypeptidase, partial [Burkholderiaceae bacterium]|nr:zinc carboxypeptidase [Burkholderiaceae bacterium]
IHALKDIFDRTHAHHRYVFEPQSRQYLAHGDLWDYLYLRSRGDHQRIFLPLTLEMGSWIWVRKNPRQLFTRHGIFNPTIAHRQHRVLRRHLPWLDFVARAACSHARWVPTDVARQEHRALALQRWYGGATR